MTLIIGSIHDGELTLVADTKVTYDAAADETRTRRELLLRPTLKLMIVSPVLAVGFAGDLPADLTGLYRAVYANPDDIEATVEVLRDRSRRFNEVFLAAALVPRPTLWRIRDGAAPSSSTPGRVAIGDLDAYEYYLQRQERLQHPGSTGLGSEHLELQAVIQWFANVDDGPSERTADNVADLRAFTGDQGARYDRTIGGYVTQVATAGPRGFRYVPITQQTLPGRFRFHRVHFADGKLTLTGRTVGGVAHLQYTMGGAPVGRGAIGFCLPEAGSGVLYPDGRPWEMQVYTGLSSAEEFVKRAWFEHGQILLGHPEPTYVPVSCEPADVVEVDIQRPPQAARHG